VDRSLYCLCPGILTNSKKILLYGASKLFGFNASHCSFVYWQGLSVLIAMLLKALGPHPHRHYDSDDEYNVSTVALLQDARQPPPYVVGEPMYGAKPGAWTVRLMKGQTGER